MNNQKKLVKSLIAVPNKGRGDVVIINSETETLQLESINIETGSPMYVDTSIDRNEFYIRDHDTVYIYDSITLNRINIINNTNCQGNMGTYYNEHMHQLWHLCKDQSKFVVIDVQNNAIISTMSIDFLPFWVVTFQNVAFISGLKSVKRNKKTPIIVKYSAETFKEINRDTIGNGKCKDPHLFFDDLESNTDFNHFIFSTCENINMVYKIDTNTLHIVDSLQIFGAHGIYGRGNYFYIGNAAGYIWPELPKKEIIKAQQLRSKTIGAIHLINVYYNMRQVTVFNDSIIGHIHCLMINCEGNKLFITDSYVNNAVSVFDIGDNGQLIGQNRVIYQNENAEPLSLNKICIYANSVAESVIEFDDDNNRNIPFNNHLVIHKMTYVYIYWWVPIIAVIYAVRNVKYCYSYRK